MKEKRTTLKNETKEKEKEKNTDLETKNWTPSNSQSYFGSVIFKFVSSNVSLIAAFKKELDFFVLRN